MNSRFGFTWRKEWGGVALASGLLAIALALAIRCQYSSYAADVGGDAYTYIRFARQWAQGHATIQDPVSRFVAVWPGNRSSGTPIWNTALLPDGRWVYTVAPGYPLFLAVLLRLGGNGLLLHSNLLLQGAVLLCFAGFAFLSAPKRKEGWRMALLAGLLLLLMDPTTQRQFINLWREPFLFLLLLSAGCLLLRMPRNPLAYYGIPLLLGYACAVKESSVLLAGWMGLVLLLDSDFRRRPGLVRRLVVGGLLFAAGCAPLLWQNSFYTGRPWLSLYALRETGAFSLTDSGAGLSVGNIWNTLGRYVDLYKPEAYWLIPLLAFALGSAWFLRRERAVQLMAGWLALHVGLYLQWGNAAGRHMYFAVFPLVFLAVRGLDAWLADRLQAGRIWNSVVGLAGIALLIGLARTPCAAVDFGYRGWNAFVQDVARRTEPNAIILVNRLVRDVLGGYADLGVIRLDELLDAVDADVQTLLATAEKMGVPIYFVDNPDRDPASVQNRVDLARMDQNRLLEFRDLEEISRYAQPQRYFQRLGGTAFALYRVKPWSQTVVERTLEEPSDGAAFLFLHPRGAATHLAVTLNGAPLEPDFRYGYWLPLPARPQGPLAVRVASRDGSPIPSLGDLQIVDWLQPMILPCGADAVPDDRPLFPGLSGPQPLRNRRYFRDRMVLRVPAREGADLFTVADVLLPNAPDQQSPYQWLAGAAESAPFSVTGRVIRIPLPPLGEKTERTALYRDVELKLPSQQELSVRQVALRTVQTVVTWPAPPAGQGVLVAGELVPLSYGSQWSARAGDVVVAQGLGVHEPGLRFVQYLPPGAASGPLRFQGAGLIDPSWTPAGDDPQTLGVRENRLERIRLADKEEAP
jgi:hypothetical protein